MSTWPSSTFQDQNKVLVYVEARNFSVVDNLKIKKNEKLRFSEFSVKRIKILLVIDICNSSRFVLQKLKMSGIGLARTLQRSCAPQTRGVAFEAAIIAAASKKVHMTLSKLASGIMSSPNSMEFSLDGEAITYKPPVITVNCEDYDDYAILESARAKELHDSLQNVVTLRPNKSEQHARI